jgi:peptide deformylase
MLDNNGLGIAAPQVGYNLMLLVLAPNNFQLGIRKALLVNGFLCLVNPRITILDARPISVKEGCLSLPGAESLSIARAKRTELVTSDITGTQHCFTLDGMESIIMQHEVDHLNGLLYPARSTQGMRIMEKYARNKKISIAEVHKFAELMKKNLVLDRSTVTSEAEFLQQNSTQGIDESTSKSIWSRIMEING